jgi:hypothetical protein
LHGAHPLRCRRQADPVVRHLAGARSGE